MIFDLIEGFQWRENIFDQRMVHDEIVISQVFPLLWFEFNLVIFYLAVEDFIPFALKLLLIEQLAIDCSNIRIEHGRVTLLSELVIDFSADPFERSHLEWGYVLWY